MSIAITIVEPITSEFVDPAKLTVGTEIDFGDEGTGEITDRDGDRVYLKSPVFTGWTDAAGLAASMRLNTGDRC